MIEHAIIVISFLYQHVLSKKPKWVRHEEKLIEFKQQKIMEELINKRFIDNPKEQLKQQMKKMQG